MRLTPKAKLLPYKPVVNAAEDKDDPKPKRAMSYLEPSSVVQIKHKRDLKLLVWHIEVEVNR